MRDPEFRDRLGKKGLSLEGAHEFLDAYLPAVAPIFLNFLIAHRKRFQLAARETKPQRISTRETK